VLSFPVAVQRLKAAAEAAKIALSSQTSTRVVIPDLLPGEALLLCRVGISIHWLPTACRVWLESDIGRNQVQLTDLNEHRAMP